MRAPTLRSAKEKSWVHFRGEGAGPGRRVGACRAGQIVDARPDVALSHDNTAAIAAAVPRAWARHACCTPSGWRSPSTTPCPRRPPSTRRTTPRSAGSWPSRASRTSSRRAAASATRCSARRRWCCPGQLDPGRRQPHDALRLAGRVRRRHRPQRDGRALGHGRALAARAGDDPGRSDGRTAAGGHRQRTWACGCCKVLGPEAGHLPRPWSSAARACAR